MKIPFFNRKLKQRCRDLEYMLHGFVQQTSVTKFEHYIFNYFYDPIGFEWEKDEEDERLQAALKRLYDTSPFFKELGDKYWAHQNGWEAWKQWCQKIDKDFK